MKSANTLFATLDFLGFPQRYALTEMTDASGTAEFSDFDLQQPDAFITDDAGRTSGLRQGPGELWTLRAKQVGQFSPAGAESFIVTWNQCIAAMSAATSTPMRFFTDPNGQHPSGDSLRAADLPLAQKISTRELSFASTWSDAFTFALQIQNITADKVIVEWVPSGPTDDLNAVSGVPMAVWKMRLGVPVRQVFRDMGYTDSQIDSWQIRPEDEFATPPQLWPMSANQPAALATAAAQEPQESEDATGETAEELAAPAAAPGAAPPHAAPAAPAAPATGAPQVVKIPAHTRTLPSRPVL